MQARTRPAEGGWFYASAALSDCEAMALDGTLDEEVSKTIAKRATVSPQQVTALDRYRRRCAGFTTGGRAEMAEWLAALKGRRDDPLLDIAMDLNAAHTSEARRPVLQAMLDAHDSLLTSTMWPALSRADELAGGLASGEWFDGIRYRAGIEASRDEVAMEMAVCRPHSPCAADRGAELRCMTTGECGDPTTHLDLRVIDLSHADPDEAAMVRLARDMRAKLDRADLDAFRAPGSARR